MGNGQKCFVASANQCINNGHGVDKTAHHIYVT